MIDFHTHILPGLDDGAINVDESILMARVLADFGYRNVCCTPHCIKGYYDLTAQKVREATLMLQADLDNAGIQLELWPGMEYMLDESFAEFADDLLPLGETRLVLCEAPSQAHPGIVREGLAVIAAKGFVPLVAHPERTQYFYDLLSSRDTGPASGEAIKAQNWDEGFGPGNASETTGFFNRIWPFSSRRSRDTSRSLRGHVFHSQGPALPEGCLFHANLGSFTGYYGPDVQRRAYELLKRGAYTALASDLHDSRSASQVLVRDKFDLNPLLKKLAGFDGAVNKQQGAHSGGQGGQGELF